MTTKGVLMFAHNNPEIDYLKLAITNAYLVQVNLGLPKEEIAIVTDMHSYNYVLEHNAEDFVSNACGNYIFKEKDTSFKNTNIRQYKDTNHKIKGLSFYNLDRCDAYDLTPFDETIMIDADYLVLSDSLNQCWGHGNELMMNWDYKDALTHRKFTGLHRINPLTIKMYWATVVYFRKSTHAEHFFDILKYVRENVEYYKIVYRFPGNVYRNDYIFSAAAHLLMGYQDAAVPQLPITLYQSFDIDDVHKVSSLTQVHLFLEHQTHEKEFIITKWEGVDIHIMNKWALGRITNDIIRLLGEH